MGKKSNKIENLDKKTLPGKNYTESSQSLYQIDKKLTDRRINTKITIKGGRKGTVLEKHHIFF